MYIFELLYNTVIKIIRKKPKNIENENDTECSHIFLPVDSTKKILACTKCGLLIKAENLKKIQSTNLFEK